MTNWFDRVAADPADLAPLLTCIDHFEAEYQRARADVKLSGNLERLAGQLPAKTDYHFGNQKELEAILEYLNIRKRVIRSRHYRKYNEHYNRALTQRDLDRYVDGEDEVAAFDQLVVRFSALVNRYSGIIKALEVQGYQINNITRLRVAGMEDAEVG